MAGYTMEPHHRRIEVVDIVWDITSERKIF
jgi:hypothetical protein